MKKRFLKLKKLNVPFSLGSIEKKIAGVIASHSPEAVLSVNVGEGKTLCILGKMLPNAHFQGVDTSKHHFESIYKNCGPALLHDRLTLREYDGLVLPFEDNTFDATYVVHGIASWKEPNTLLAALVRVTSVRGKVFIAMKYPKNRTYATVMSGLKPDDVVKALEAHSMQITNIDNISSITRGASVLIQATKLQ